MTESATQPVILVIDDERDVRRFLRTLLELDGYTVYEAMNGPLGRELIPLIDPDAVLLDVVMPEPDGVEVCRKITLDYPALPVIILTSHDDRDLIGRCFQAGASGYLAKPLFPGELATLLATLELPTTSRLTTVLPSSATSPG